MTDDNTPISLTETNRYWTDRAYRQRCDAETAHARALANEAIDRGMAGLNARQAARWAGEGV